jgi:hypothetical protein
MFCLAYQGGVKLVELAAISLDDLGYDSKQDRVTVCLKATKKARGRIIALHNVALIALEDWLEWRGRNDGPLLCQVRRDATVETGRLSVTAVRQCCAKRAGEAGLEVFSLNDLARNTTSPQLVKKAARSKNSSGRSGKAWSLGASVLYAGEAATVDEDREEGEHRRARRTETVQFPYLTREHGHI